MLQMIEAPMPAMGVAMVQSRRARVAVTIKTKVAVRPEGANYQ